jgi:hypothetical protein
MLQNDTPTTVHSISNGELQGFQVETPLLFPVSKSQFDQRLDLALDLVEDLGFRFFLRDFGSSAPASCNFKSQISWLV